MAARTRYKAESNTSAKEASRQDGVGHRYPLQRRGGGDGVRPARPEGALVFTGAGTPHADRRQRRTARAVRCAASLPGKVGGREEGALADLLLVAGDPVAGIDRVTDPARTFVVTMKDGKTYKSLLP